MSALTILTSKRTISAIVCSLSIAAMAATPVAVWDGDFTATQTGFTLNRSGNAISQDNSTITIDQSVGVKVDSTTGFSSAMTVMFKYSDLAFDAQKTLATSFCSGYDENRTGVYAASGGTINGIWNTADWAHPAQTLSASSGVLAFCYSKTAGTSLYSVGASSRNELFNESGLKAGNDTAINGCTIGGERAKSGATLLSAATGMKITGIAIFDGILTEAEMTGYIWPSEIQTIDVNANMSVSAINALYDSTTYKAAKVTVASGLTITVDEAFSEKIQSVSSTGSITLSAASQPDLSGVSFDVQGALLRSWLTPGVVGVNFHKAQGNVVSDELVTSGSWVATTGANGASTDLFADGLTKVMWSASGTYSYFAGDNESVSFLHGYLDDGANKGNGVEIYVDNIPYETYDVVIYASTDTSGVKFRAKTVNGFTYTSTMSGVVSAGNADWGASRLETPLYGLNAMRIKNLSGKLSILGGTNNGNRGGISAIQIMPTTADDKPEAEYMLELDGTDTKWSEGAWKIGESAVAAPLSGSARVTLSASTTLTVDNTVALNHLVIDGLDNAVLTIVLDEGASLVSYSSVDVVGGVLKQGAAAVIGNTPQLVVEDGGTFDMNGLEINASTKVYLAGAGAGNWPWALTSSSGAGGAILGGLYLSANATIGGANELKVGQTGAGYYCYLQGFTLTKTGAGAFTGTNMNTPGTGTIEVQGGAMSVNQWNNLNSANGDTTVILNSGTSLANGTDRVISMSALGLYGGTLSTASRAFKVKTALRGAGETANLAFGDGASASLTGNLTVTATMTLDGSRTFLKDQEAASDVVVTPAALTASSGTITVGSGVIFNVGTSRPGATITVLDGGTLAAQLQSASDVIALSTSAQPANVILYDANGDVVSNPSISYSEGTLTIMPHAPTLVASGAVAFDTAANWNDSTMPSANGDAIIQLADDATITVSGTYTLASLNFTGSGVATFSGEGTITAANISVKNGATFTRNANISATTGISLDAGTVLRLDGVTENAAISGAGAVETYGTVVLAHGNTMTGGITVKPGSALSTTAAGGYGEYQSGWAYTAQRQVVVEDGGTVDINNVANNDGAVALTIAGKGILSDDVYSGAVTYSGAAAITSGSRQISSLVLTGDAMVDVGAGWGLVHSGWQNARLGLNGHTLTVRGTGTFPVVNANNLSGAATTGTLVLDGATLELSNAASNLAGINVVAKGCATINVAKAPSALGSLTLKPSATGTTALGWDLPSTPIPSLDTSNVDPTGLTGGQVLTLFTAPSALSTDTISVNAGGRFKTTVNDYTVTATFTVGMPANFMHYDFNEANSRATDSTWSCGNMNPSFVASKNGRAGVFDANTKPYYGSNTSGKSPFHAGEMTVTSLLKVREANNTILWNFGSGLGGNAGIALLAKNSSTVSLVQWTNGAANGNDVVSVTDVDLLNKWHFVTIVANASGTTLYVDDKFATVDTVLPSGISGQGQFGSIHSAKGKYEWLLADGYLLDDWRVYDAALTAKEIKALKRELNPDPLFIRLR